MRLRKLQRFQQICEIDTRQLDRNFNVFNNETSGLKIRVAKQIQVMLIFYLNFKATNLKYNSRIPRKLVGYETIRKILDNLTDILLSSFDS